MTETEIAQELEVDQSTVSRDIKVLKELSQQFVYDLAKSDLDDLLVLNAIPGFLPREMQ
jgi:arginine repressor